MFDGLGKYIASGAFRHLATALGGVLVAMGLSDDAQVTTTTDAIQVLFGALMTIGGFMHSVWNKFRVEKKIHAVAKSGNPNSRID